MSINANIHQPNICLSLTSEWFCEMMKGPEYGALWCRNAYAAKNLTDSFYRTHAIMQENLTQKTQKVWIRKIVETLSIDAFTHNYPHEYLRTMQAIQPVTNDFLSGESEKRALLYYRQLRVVHEIKPASIGAIQALIMQNVESPKYYLISFKMLGENTNSHVIGIVNARCYLNKSISQARTQMALQGSLYYYDPNQKRVFETQNHVALSTILGDSFRHIYHSTNMIYELSRVT